MTLAPAGPSVVGMGKRVLVLVGVVVLASGLLVLWGGPVEMDPQFRGGVCLGVPAEQPCPTATS